MATPVSPSTTPLSRYPDLVSRLSLAEKVRLLTGASGFTLAPQPEIGLDSIVLSDGPSGVRGPVFAGGEPACLLPNATLLSQQWDPAVMARVGRLLAEEARAQGVDVVLGPTVNLHRTPLSGRLYESFSEDPLLTGELAAAYIDGLQQRGVGATIKHFVANESETDRKTSNSVVDERTLREVYLLPFEIAVAQAQPWTAMAAYNLINGVPATENRRLLTDVLRGEWGFDGLVMSDWYAATTTAATANAGLDLIMPGPASVWGDQLVAAVENGEVAERTVDEHVERVLQLADRVGALGRDRATRVPGPAPSSPGRREELREIAAAGMVVVRNRDSAIPLASPGRVALIGRHALATVAQGAGSAQVRPPHVVSLADGLKTALGARIEVVDGVAIGPDPLTADIALLRDPATGLPGMRVSTLDDAGEVLETQRIEWGEVFTRERPWLRTGAAIQLEAEIALPDAGRWEVGIRGRGEWDFEVAGHSEHVVLDRVDTAGEVLRVPYRTAVVDGTSPLVIRALVQAPSDDRILGLAVRRAAVRDIEAIRNAVEAAREADVAIVAVGLTPEQETEEVDKLTLALPGAQDALVAAVARVARRTVVVVNAATPVLMPWLDDVDAVLIAGLPGQEAGDAIADALTGRTEPAGRLVTTFPSRDGDGPVWSGIPVDGDNVYSEGLAVGYRGWTQAPLFAFGHGLGYATWEYSNLALQVADVLEGVSVDITNTGERESTETVQVYWRPAGEVLRLVGWARATLAPGETRTVDVPVRPWTRRRWTEEGWRELPLSG